MYHTKIKLGNTQFLMQLAFLYLHFVVSYFVMQLVYSVETSLIQTRLKLFDLFILQVIDILQIGRKLIVIQSPRNVLEHPSIT